MRLARRLTGRVRAVALGALPALACVAFAAQAQPAPASAPASAPAATAAAVVDIRDHSFVPALTKVRAGSTVRWTNSEKRTTHSVLFPGAGGVESERLFPGESWERRFDQPGRYPYTCGPHPEMNGVVEVEP